MHVCLSWAPFEEFQIDEALEHLEAKRSSDDQASDENAPTLPSRSKIEAFRKNVGLVADIDLTFISTGCLHIYKYQAEWFESFVELSDALEDDQDDTGDTTRVNEVDKELVKKWASQLATHPKYGITRTGDQREFLLESLAGTEFDPLPTYEILSRADSIYQFEIKPDQEKELSQEAKRLKQQGLNMNAIASKLGISRDRVSGLLSL